MDLWTATIQLYMVCWKLLLLASAQRQEWIDGRQFARRLKTSLFRAMRTIVSVNQQTTTVGLDDSQCGLCTRGR